MTVISKNHWNFSGHCLNDSALIENSSKENIVPKAPLVFIQKETESDLTNAEEVEVRYWGKK